MHDTLFVRRRQSPRHLQRIVNRLPAGKRPAPYALPQSLAFEQFGNNVRSSALLPDIENRKNVGMIQRRCRARFLREPLQPLRICRVRGRQNLNGHDAIEPRIVRSIHFSHASRTNQGLDLVGAQFRSWSECHLSCGLYRT